MEQNNNPTKKKYDKPNYRFDFYKDMRTWKETPVTDSWKHALAKDLYEWAKDDDNALKLSQFYLERGISSDDWKRWVLSNDNLKRATAAALQFIGNRREIGSIKRKYDNALIARSMPRYDSEWKEICEWWATLKAETEHRAAQGGPKYVVVENLEQIASLANKPSPEEVARLAKRKVTAGRYAGQAAKRKKKEE